MRARNIKPGFFENEVLGQADPIVCLLFAGLWCIADKAGRLEDRPMRIKAQVFPYREGLDINGYLTELERLGFIQRYMAGSTRLIQVLQFEKHQHPHHTERESELPEFTDGCELTVKQPLIHGDTPSDSLIPDSLIPEVPPTPLGTAPPSAKAEKPPRVKKLKTTELKPESLEAFQAAWETIPASVVRWDATVRREVEEAVAKGSRAEAERNFQAIVDAKIATPRTLYVALYAYITEGEGPKKGFVQHCATFYGPKKRTYLEWLDRARAIEAERYGVPE